MDDFEFINLSVSTRHNEFELHTSYVIARVLMLSAAGSHQPERGRRQEGARQGAGRVGEDQAACCRI